MCPRLRLRTRVRARFPAIRPRPPGASSPQACPRGQTVTTDSIPTARRTKHGPRTVAGGLGCDPGTAAPRASHRGLRERRSPGPLACRSPQPRGLQGEDAPGVRLPAQGAGCVVITGRTWPEPAAKATLLQDPLAGLAPRGIACEVGQCRRRPRHPHPVTAQRCSSDWPQRVGQIGTP